MAISNASAAHVAVRHVLVPVDGSEFALRALPTARALGQRLAAEVQTISVANSGEEDRLRTLAAGALGVAVGDERAAVVTDGDPADVIVSRAEELGSTLICLTTHGRGRLSGAVIGSVARTVVQQTTEPIVALGPMADNPGWSPRPRSWPEPLSVPRLVACVDGSAESEQVLPVAAGWAAALGMAVTILTVISDDPPPIRREGTEIRFGSYEDADSYINDLVQRWTGSVEDVDGQVVRDPVSVASGIRVHLDERPAGVVAVTTHARSGLQRVRFGATAASIVHASVAPCLVARVT